MQLEVEPAARTRIDPWRRMTRSRTAAEVLHEGREPTVDQELEPILADMVEEELLEVG